MQRRIISLVGIVAVVSLWGGVSAVSGAGQADAPAAGALKVAAPRIGWGEPQDGLQIGLFPQNSQKSVRYGDTITLVMRARNVSRNPIVLNMTVPEISSVTLGEKGRLVLQTLGGRGNTTLFRLTPGQTEDLPGGSYTARIVAPGEELAGIDKAASVVALLPGEYQAECSFPIWMPDKEDANRATAHRAKPGLFAFTVLPDEKRQPKIGKADPGPEAAIAWGESVNGLQGGLYRMTEKDLAALPADQRKAVAADEILTRFYVRNTTDKPLRLTYHNFSENDASYWVKDAQGKDHIVHATFFTGLRPLSEQTLPPGEYMAAGWGRLKVLPAEMPLDQRMSTPLLAAEPGQYTLQLISSVRFTGLNHFDMALVSATVPFTITAQ